MAFPSSGDVSPTTITSPISTWRRSSLPTSSSPSMGVQHTSKIRRRALAGFFVCLMLFLWATSSSYRARRSNGMGSWRAAIQQATSKHVGEASTIASSPNSPPKLIKLSMLYGNETEHYERALETQQKHSERWGHELRILREDIASGFWNKPNYILATIIDELAKPRGERAEWVMWVDADSIILNPAVPPEIFLPPRELPDLHLIATQDHNGLNTGIMFLRIHPWSIKMLTEAAGYPLYYPDKDLGRNEDQEAMRLVLAREDGGWDGKGYRDNAVFIPRTWINAYEWGHGYEGNKGDFLVHFAGMPKKDRWEHMEDWFDILGRHADQWEVSMEETGHPANATAYWEQVQAATQAVQMMQLKLAGMPNETDSEVEAREKWEETTRELQTVLWEHADDVELLRTTQRDLVAGDL